MSVWFPNLNVCNYGCYLLQNSEFINLIIGKQIKAMITQLSH